jgi:uncharacterized protein involved in outer membrane biogenesis
MSFDPRDLGTRAAGIARHPRTKKIAIGLVALIALVGILGGIAAPLLLRRVLADQLSAKLHRQVSIEQIRINPYTMTAAIRGLVMKERQSPAAAVSFDELYVNLQLESLFRLAPVIKEFRLVKPYIHLIRNEDRTYNYQDLINEFTSGPSGGPTPQFALNNIEIVDGKVEFDDRPEKTKHTISSLHIGIPFISSLPSYTKIKVRPRFSAIVNGAPIDIGGEAEPFTASRASTIHLRLEKLQIPQYLEYSPLDLNFTVPSGQMNGDLTVSFSEQPSLLTVSGNVLVKDFAMKEKAGSQLISLPSLEIAIGAFEAFANRASFKAIKLEGSELTLRRERDGSLNLSNLIMTPPAKPATQPAKPGAPFIYHIDGILLDAGKLHFVDETTATPFRTDLKDVHVDIKNLSNESEKKSAVEISFESAASESFKHTGVVQLNPLAGEGQLAIEKLQPAALKPYYADALAGDVREGSLDLTAHYAFTEKNGGVDVKLSDVSGTLRGFRLDLPGESEPLWRIPLFSIKDAALDLANRAVTIGVVEAHDGIGYVRREKDGSLIYQRLLRPNATRASDTAGQKNKEEPWKIESKQVAFDRFRLSFDDRTPARPARTDLSNISLRARNISTAKNQRARINAQLTVNNKGLLKISGSATSEPITGNFDIDAQNVDLLGFRPYIENQINFLLTGGSVSSKAKLVIDGSGSGPMKIKYEGNAQLADFYSLESDGAQDLLRWKSLNLDGVQFANSPMLLQINGIQLADFYARLILAPDGTTNLQHLTVPSSAGPEQAPAQKNDEKAQPAAATAPAPADDSRVVIGKIRLDGGNINFTDLFIKPNYSANLTSVQGDISELTPDAPGTIQLEAKLDNSAPVDIRGRINPLSKQLFLDIAADARDIELTPFSPYSGKYVGYGIEKGKLSFNVKYKLEDRKLNAENKIILNQLTFGDKVESPDAVKLPVLLAVALLKDRNGVIDVDLPISGSLDDPQFSVAGIVLRIIGNIITKAVTAPFALLGSLFGGGGEELSYIEFDYGRAAINPAAQTKIESLAKAMNNRPALKIDISGRVDPVNDLEGLKKAAIENKVKAQKLKEMTHAGEAVTSVEDVQIAPSEYDRYLKAAYGEEKFSKPRNMIGLAKDLPRSEMEALMLQHVQVTDDDLRNLAARRAEAVRNRLLKSGDIAPDRLFITGSKTGAGDDKENAKAKASRVDFALR